jgi:hypothetical protein
MYKYEGLSEDQSSSKLFGKGTNIPVERAYSF